MQIAFRTDASLQIGSGHVMRCLTLADALKAHGAECQFICRAHLGHLMEVIRQRGFVVNSLVGPQQQEQEAIANIETTAQFPHQNWLSGPSYESWLGSTWQTDSQHTAALLANLQPDWLVVDHYALDKRWEEALRAHYRKLLVIDDLADRLHSCNLLLDQNLGRQPQDYFALVHTDCKVLTGPYYALLGPDFAEFRHYSLQRRKAQSSLRQLLITMGGVDQPNATGLVLEALKACALPPSCRITVVMGVTAPWLQDVQELAKQMPWHTEVVVNVKDMARRMANSDLAIGAAGSTSWERCCLGLPTLIVCLAQNQLEGAHALSATNAAKLVGNVNDILSQMPLLINELVSEASLTQMVCNASSVTDGLGVEKVLRIMGSINV